MISRLISILPSLLGDMKFLIEIVTNQYQFTHFENIYVKGSQSCPRMSYYQQNYHQISLGHFFRILEDKIVGPSLSSNCSYLLCFVRVI